MSPHDAVVTRIREAFEKKGFLVQIRGNNLPVDSDRSEAIYRPDLLVKRQSNKNIAWIIEVETGDPGKSVVGAAILADVCMEMEIERGQQHKKPGLVFIFYQASANLNLAHKRIRQLIARRRVNNLGEIKILTEKKALSEIARA
jgi:hypothetical protein